MNLSGLEQRVRALERMSIRLRLNGGSSHRSGQQMNSGTASLLGQLEDLMHEVKLMKEEAQAAGDHRSALACVREFCRIVELTARLRGELDEKSPTNILHMHLDSETAKRIAEAYLARRRRLESK